MKPKAYIETSVISYLTALPARDIVAAGRQQITREWWCDASDRFELVISELVVSEASAGDSDAVTARLEVLSAIQMVDADDSSLRLAEDLITAGAIPHKAAGDAAHIAIAVTNGAEYLVTWNCRHIANAVMRSKIESVCRNAGYDPIIICTPDELRDADDEETNV